MTCSECTHPCGNQGPTLRPVHVLPYRIMYDDRYSRTSELVRTEGELVGGTLVELAQAAEALMRGVILSWGNVDHEHAPSSKADALDRRRRQFAEFAFDRHGCPSPVRRMGRSPIHRLDYVGFGRHRIELRDVRGSPAELDETAPEWARLSAIQDDALTELREAVERDFGVYKGVVDAEGTARNRQETSATGEAPGGTRGVNPRALPSRGGL